MGKWFLNVPKKLHVYWGTEPLPYLRYKTVESFMKYNPSWDVILWLPKYPAKVLTWSTRELDYKSVWDDCFPDLIALPIEKKFLNFEDFKFPNDASEVHKCDFIRYRILAEFGGVYSDMDILYFKPITKLKVNIPENKDKDTFVCISNYGHSNGFFMSAPDSKFFRRAAYHTLQEYRKENYQSLGPDLCNKYFPDMESVNKISPAVNIDMEAVYAHDAQHIKEIYTNTKPRFTENSIGCHWYAGHQLAGKFLKDTNGGKERVPNNLIGNLL